jgi:hypothetical protein
MVDGMRALPDGTLAREPKGPRSDAGAPEKGAGWHGADEGEMNDR